MANQGKGAGKKRPQLSNSASASLGGMLVTFNGTREGGIDKLTATVDWENNESYNAHIVWYDEAADKYKSTYIETNTRDDVNTPQLPTEYSEEWPNWGNTTGTKYFFGVSANGGQIVGGLTIFVV